ncbi:MAG: hypothetical protein Harvfovirus55_11 [Harvfovirus sp.]|uniref:Uncharacterized protein n=1 Tax=Harvfovirus sp. TaxID=2487768 RepID=A0A3G5A3D1_9VIRU|nr:MAG: hypothetical protein Harvfovirus55_11 [Harvfovirus sp.]
MATQPKWVRSLAAMVISFHVVYEAIRFRGAHFSPSAVLPAIRSVGSALKWTLLNFSVVKLQRKIRGFEDRVVNMCHNIKTQDRPSHALRQIILLRDDIDREIDSEPSDIVNFDPKLLFGLLDIDKCLDGVLPLAQGFYLYAVGEIFIAYGNEKLIDRWRRIVLERKEQYLREMIILKPSEVHIQIDMPVVLIGIIVSYTKWELRSSNWVMESLLKI